MERKKPRPMTYFDSLTMPPYLHSLKMMLPFTPASMQRMIAVYIKFLELQYTIEHFQGFPAGSSSGNILDELIRYMSPEEQEQMEQMQNMMNMMDMMQGMMSPDQQETFEQYSQMFEQELSQAQNQESKRRLFT